VRERMSQFQTRNRNERQLRASGSRSATAPNFRIYSFAADTATTTVVQLMHRKRRMMRKGERKKRSNLDKMLRARAR
jgi:hypothetical protein